VVVVGVVILHSGVRHPSVQIKPIAVVRPRMVLVRLVVLDRYVVGKDGPYPYWASARILVQRTVIVGRAMLDHAAIDVFEENPIARLFLDVNAGIVMNQIVARIDVLETIDPLGSARSAASHPHTRITIAVNAGMRDTNVVVSHRDVGTSIHRYARHSKST